MRIELLWNLPKDRFLATLQQVKSIQGRLFSPNTKTWSIPYSIPNINLVKSFGFSLDETLQRDIGVVAPIKQYVRLPEPQKEIDENKLHTLPYKLRPYQLEALRFLEANDWNGCISLGMRMGKTIVSLCGTLLHKELSPCLIVTTATGKGVWADEISFWLKEEYTILNGNTVYDIPKTPFIIVNYAILYSWISYLSTLEPKYIIIDEFHNVSNTTLFVNKTAEEYKIEKDKNDRLHKITKKQKKVPVKVTKAFLILAADCKHIVQLSGTPMTKCPRQLRVPLSIYVPRYRDEYFFLQRYCDPQQDRYGIRYDGLSNEEELFPVLDKWLFRRTKKDIWNDLPEEQHQMVSVEVDHVLYRQELLALQKEYKERNLTDYEIEEKLSKFESLSFSQKQSAIYTFIQDYIQTGNKLVVFAWHRTTIEAIYSKFKKHAIMIYGGTDPEERKDFIRMFNEDNKIQVAVLQIKSCAEAITLNADTIAYAELPPTPGLLQQSAERIWIAEGGQKKLFYYYFIARDTVDKKRVDLLRKRAMILNKTLDRSNDVGELFGTKLLEDI